MEGGERVDDRSPRSNLKHSAICMRFDYGETVGITAKQTNGYWRFSCAHVATIVFTKPPVWLNLPPNLVVVTSLHMQVCGDYCQVGECSLVSFLSLPN